MLRLITELRQLLMSQRVREIPPQAEPLSPVQPSELESRPNYLYVRMVGTKAECMNRYVTIYQYGSLKNTSIMASPIRFPVSMMNRKIQISQGVWAPFLEE